MKHLADGSGHIINAASPFFGREQPECRVALWIQVDDQDPFIMIRSQAGANVDRIRGLTDASFEIDKGDYLAHLTFLGLRCGLNQTDLVTRDEQKNLERTPDEKRQLRDVLDPELAGESEQDEKPRVSCLAGLALRLCVSA
jgi:hypothetical protein